MKSMVDLSHLFLKPSLHRQAICVDATLGHGKDAQFFLEAGVRKVYGFEIQEDVWKETQERIQDPRLIIFPIGHEHMDQIQEEVDAIVFNFGYAPQGDPSITTQPKSSLEAVKKALTLLKHRGRLALVFYPHAEGEEEKERILSYLETLGSTYEIFHIQKVNATSPSLVGIEKK